MNYPLAVFVPELGARSETFIRRHVCDLLPGRTVAIGLPLSNPEEHDWSITGPLVAQGCDPDPASAATALQRFGVEALLGEYLSDSIAWLDIARQLGIRFIVHAHGYDVSQCLRDATWRERYQQYRDAAAVITMSQYSRRRLVDIGLPEQKVHVIPYGVDVPDRFRTRPLSDGVRVLAVGRMVAKKSPILTLDAFRRAAAECPGMRLDYIGAGPLYAAATQSLRAFELEGRAALHGGRPSALVADFMQRADIFVQHSATDVETGDEEGLPVAILEAMAAGLPVVATRHAGIPEAVLDGLTGFLVDEGDTRRMGELMTALGRDRGLRLGMGEAGWRRASAHYAWPTERARLLDVLGLQD